MSKLTTVMPLLVFYTALLAVLQLRISKGGVQGIRFMLPTLTFVVSVTACAGNALVGRTAGKLPFTPGGLVCFVALNLPTALLLLIYFYMREKRHQQWIVEMTTPDRLTLHSSEVVATPDGFRKNTPGQKGASKRKTATAANTAAVLATAVKPAGVKMAAKTPSPKAPARRVAISAVCPIRPPIPMAGRRQVPVPAMYYRSLSAN